MAGGALAPLEGAGPVPRPPLPRRDVRRARHRPVVPARRRRVVHRPRVRGRRRRGARRHRHRSGRAGRPVVRVDLGRPHRGRPPRPGRRHRGPRPLLRARRRPAPPRVVRLGRRARHDRGMGEVQPALLVGRRLRRLRPLLLRPDVLRAPLHQADRGHDRVGPRDRARHAGRRHRGPAGMRRGRVRLDRGGMRACHVPGARRPRRRRPHPHRRRRPAAGRAHRRIVRVAGRQRARTSCPRPGADQRADPRLRRVPAPAGDPGGHDVDPGRVPTPAGALPVLPHRPRTRPPRPRHRPGAAHPPPRPADRLARTGPRDPSARRRRRVGPPRVLVVGQRDGPHRRRGRRARPPRVPGHPAHGRDPRRQLRRVPRRGRGDAVRPRRRRRGLGRRLLPAREPRAQAVRLRLDDRLRRMAAHARRRRATKPP